MKFASPNTIKNQSHLKNKAIFNSILQHLYGVFVLCYEFLDYQETLYDKNIHILRMLWRYFSNSEVMYKVIYSWEINDPSI